jgi:hypothetical protein
MTGTGKAVLAVGRRGTTCLSILLFGTRLVLYLIFQVMLEELLIEILAGSHIDPIDVGQVRYR